MTVSKKRLSLLLSLCIASFNVYASKGTNPSLSPVGQSEAEAARLAAEQANAQPQYEQRGVEMIRGRLAIQMPNQIFSDEEIMSGVNEVRQRPPENVSVALVIEEGAPARLEVRTTFNGTAMIAAIIRRRSEQLLHRVYSFGLAGAARNNPRPDNSRR